MVIINLFTLGHPFWPAKVVRIDAKKKEADCRFFGAHDRFVKVLMYLNSYSFRSLEHGFHSIRAFNCPSNTPGLKPSRISLSLKRR